MNGLSNWLRDYFGFSATELRGFWLLSFVAIIFLIMLATLKPLFILGASWDDTTVTTTHLDSLVAILEQQRSEEKSQQLLAKETSTFISFDPNIATREVLEQNNIPQWLVDRIIKYRDRGGKFLKKDDLLKIYGFPVDLHTSLYSYIRLPEQYRRESSNKVKYKSTKNSNHKTQSQSYRKTEKMNINTVDSITLQQIFGIGEVLSARIVRFREKLGGFHSLDQLSEIYHISPEVVQNLKDNSFLPPDNNVNKVNINADEVSTLASHPYISFSLARAIVKHREMYGSFNSLNDCQEVYLMEDSIIQKLRPYLNF